MFKLTIKQICDLMRLMTFEKIRLVRQIGPTARLLYEAIIIKLVVHALAFAFWHYIVLL